VTSPPLRPDPAPLVHEVAALERTALAWERTAISLAAVGTLLLKALQGETLAQLAGLVLVGAAAVIVLVMVPVGYARARRRIHPTDPASSFVEPDRWRGVTMAVTAALVSLTAAALAADLWLIGLL
jgi:hypothetical protein